MNKLLSSAIAISVLTPAISMAEVTYTRASASFASVSVDGVSATSYGSAASVGAETGDFNYGIALNYHEFPEAGLTENAVGAWAGYNVNNSLYVELGYAMDGEIGAVSALGEYSFSNTTIGLSYAQTDDEFTDIGAYALYEPTNDIMVGAMIGQMGLAGEEAMYYGLGGEYTAEKYKIAGLVSGNEYYTSLDFAGEYEIADSLSILLGASALSANDDMTSDVMVAGAGLGFDFSENVRISAIYSRFNIDEISAPGFGVGVTYKFGKARTAGGRIDDTVNDMRQIAWGFYN